MALKVVAPEVLEGLAEFDSAIVQNTATIVCLRLPLQIHKTRPTSFGRIRLQSHYSGQVNQTTVSIYIMHQRPEEHRPYEQPDRPGLGNPENWDPPVRHPRTSSKIHRPEHHGGSDHRIAAGISSFGWVGASVYIGGFSNIVPKREIYWKILSYVLVSVVLLFAFIATSSRLQGGAPIPASLFVIVGVGSALVLAIRFVATWMRITVLRRTEFADPIGFRNRSILKHGIELIVVSGWLVWLLLEMPVSNPEFMLIELCLIGCWLLTRWFASKRNRPLNVWERRPKHAGKSDQEHRELQHQTATKFQYGND